MYSKDETKRRESVLRGGYKKEIIYNNDGSIRKCPKTVASQGYWLTLWRFHGYKEVIKEVFSISGELLDAVVIIFTFLFYVAIFPAIPFIRAFYDYRRCVKICKIEYKQKTKG